MSNTIKAYVPSPDVKVKAVFSNNHYLNSEQAGAKFSGCGKYRYALWRIWTKGKPVAMCIGLNPSTANFLKNDNTIDTLIRVLAKLGYGGFYMTNLFAFISSKPNDLLTCEDPLKDNDFYLDIVRKKSDDVIFCWGAFKQAKDRANEIIARYPEAKCFDFTADGSPWHPRAMIYEKGRLESPILFDYSTNQLITQNYQCLKSNI